MSLTDFSDRWFRPEDKALLSMFPAVEDLPQNAFSEFFHEDLYDSGNQQVNPIKDEYGEVESLFALNLSDPEEVEKLDHVDICKSDTSSPQPWRKGVWCLGKSKSPLHVAKTRNTRDAPISYISPAHLIAHEDLTANAYYDTKSPSPDRLQYSHCPSPFEQQRRGDNMNLSTSPMYSRPFYSSRYGFVEDWQSGFEGFNLGLDDDQTQTVLINEGNLFLQPEIPYGHTRKHSAVRGRKMEGIRAATIHNMNYPGRTIQEANQNPRDLSSIMNANHEAANRNMFSGTPDQSDQAYKFINEDLQPMSDWATSESLHSSNSSSNSGFSSSSTENHQYATHYRMPQQAAYWSPAPAIAEMHVGHTREKDRSDLYHPKPRRATHHVLSPGYVVDNGLGIRYPQTEEIGVAIPYQPPNIQVPPVPSTPIKIQKHKVYASHPLSAYPELPPPPLHLMQEQSPFTTPRQRTTAPSR